MVVKEHSTSNEKLDTLWGWPAKKWTNLIVITSLTAFSVFVVLPFLISLIVPLFAKEVDKLEFLVDTLDGVALVLGLLGTIASGVSIIMTIADQRRFRNEKEQTAALVKSVSDLHEELSVVDSYVRKTFESNRQLSVKLFNTNIIDMQDDKKDIGVSFDTDSCDWSEVKNANEIPLSEETN